MRKDVYDYFSQGILVVLRSVGSLYTSLHILCLLIAMPIGYANWNLAIASEFYKTTDHGPMDQFEIEDMGPGLYCYFMKIFCLGGSLEKDPKVEEEYDHFDENGKPIWKPYIENNELKNVDKLDYKEIWELTQLGKYIHNCKRVDHFDDMLKEHKKRFAKIEAEFTDQGRKFTFDEPKPVKNGKTSGEGTDGEKGGSPNLFEEQSKNGQKGQNDVIEEIELENQENSVQKLIDGKDIVVEEVDGDFDLGVAHAHKAKMRGSEMTGAMTNKARAKHYVDATDEPK